MKLQVQYVFLNVGCVFIVLLG